MIELLAMIAQTVVPGDPRYRLTPGGWLIMLLSVGFVTSLLSWCIWRVLRESRAEKLPSTMDIQPPDMREP